MDIRSLKELEGSISSLTTDEKGLLRGGFGEVGDGISLHRDNGCNNKNCGSSNNGCTNGNCGCANCCTTPKD